MTDPNNNATVFMYDDVNRLTKTKDALLNETSFSYDSNGNRTAVEDANNVITYYEYCPKNLVTKQVVDYGVGNLNLTTYYDVCAMKKITKMIDPEGKVTRYQYDGLYRRTKVIDDYDDAQTKLNIETSYFYDDVGNMTRVTDDNSISTDYFYDDLNRRTKVLFTDSTYRTFEYNDVGSLTREVDQEGKVKVSLYDSLNRRTKVTDDFGGLDVDTSYYFDAVGRMTRITDDKGNPTDYEYDDNSRMTKELYADEGYKTYEFGSAGNLTRKVDQVGNVFVHSYDDLNRRTKITITPAGGVSGTTEQTFYYDAVSRMTKATDNNGSADDAVTEWVYDDAARVAQESQQVGLRDVHKYINKLPLFSNVCQSTPRPNHTSFE